jgi:hypothetical protein
MMAGASERCSNEATKTGKGKGSTISEPEGDKRKLERAFPKRDAKQIAA